MKIKSIYNILTVMAIVAFTASCDDSNDDNYEPAPFTSDGSIGVYFDSSNPTEHIFEPGKASEIELSVSRLKAEEDAEVPLLVTADKVMAFPQTVTFKAGQATAIVKVSLSNLEESRKYKFSVTVPEEYANHYAITDGSTSLTGYVMEAAWVTISDKVIMKWSTLGVENTFTTSIEQLGTVNRYRFRNFLDSGIDYVFTVGSASTAYAGYYCVNTYANYEPYEGTEAKGAYLFDDATQSYPTWTVADGNIEVADICVLEDYGTTLGYSCISFDKCSGYVYLYFTDYTDGQYEYYNPVSFSWK